MPTPITREALYDHITRAEPVVIVEALGAGYYADAHLPGAVNIPPGQVDRLAPTLLPVEDAAVVVYCSGTCSSADVVARHLERLGYTQRRRVPRRQGGLGRTRPPSRTLQWARPVGRRRRGASRGNRTATASAGLLDRDRILAVGVI